MNPYLLIFLISLIPTLESRYAIVYAYYAGIPIHLAYLVLMTTIALEAYLLPEILPYLDKVIIWLASKNVPLANKTRDFLLNRARKKGEKIKNSNKIYYELFLFVAIPLPGTGVYTGSLVYYVLGLDKHRTKATLFLGGLVAMTINTLITYSILQITIL